MDERNPATLAEADNAEHASAAASPSDHLAHQPFAPEPNSTVVFFGDAESVREGFSLALSVMQTSSNLLLPTVAPIGTRETSAGAAKPYPENE